MLQKPEQLPEALQPRWDDVKDRCAKLTGVDSLLSASGAARVFVISDFVLRTVERFAPLWAERGIDPRQPLDVEAIGAELNASAAVGQPALMSALRRERQIALAQLAWRDLQGWDSLEQSLEALSAVADACIRAASGFAYAGLCERHGVPRDSEGVAQEPMILAMGKLGGRELNFSSDVDLILLYDSPGETDGSRALSNEQFFLRHGQQLVELLDRTTADGFSYRVDLRLRPFGSAGPLAVSLPALENYLAQHGRDWERYAYIKSRLVTAEKSATELFETIIRPFVYRRYVDYGVFDALREMKALVAADVVRRERERNIKLGRGGIREIEFIVQALQLVRGGQEKSLRQSNLLTLLHKIGERALLDSDVVANLDADYRFLRRLENRLQAMGDRQTHDLPEEPERQARLAWAMGAASWSELEPQIAATRARVESEFQAFAFRDPGSQDQAERLPGWESQDEARLQQHIEGLGLPAAERIAESLLLLRNSGAYARADSTSRSRLDRLIRGLVAALSKVDDPATAVERLAPLWQSVIRRSAYIALLNENPIALDRLLQLADRSDFLIHQLINAPLLLDELLDDRLIETAPTRHTMEEEAEQVLGSYEPEQVEAFLDAVRSFRRAALFRVAVADIVGGLPLMKVSDRLTDTAELILNGLLNWAWSEMTAKHGCPTFVQAGERERAGFGIVAYGKLGGLELGYGSDLDLVFLHNSAGESQHTDGDPELDNARFFGRLAQKLLHYLTIQTPAGRLYEVDTRLRPSGRSGLMVSSMAGFLSYQEREAWTWEHQALLRSRFVAGAAAVGEAFEATRREILVRPRDPAQLAEDVSSMRRRMRKELGQTRSEAFDIKQDRGGLTDLEFLVDYLVLSHAAGSPELVEFPDKMRQLDGLAAARIVPEGEAGSLQNIYLAYRQRLHALALAGRDRVVAAEDFASERDAVSALYRAYLRGSADQAT